MAKMKTKQMLLLIACLIVVLLFCNPVAAENNGEIISANSKPDILVSGQTVTFEITVKNTGTNSLNYQIDVKKSPEQHIRTIEFLLEAGETQKYIFTSTMGDPGLRTYYYRLYIDWTWPSDNELLDTVIETRRCFSIEEVSDNDHDNLPYYVEVEDLKTDPNNPDTDDDGKRDDVDKRPTIAEGSISITSNPSGANIYLDGISKGITSSTLTNIPIGSHTVKLTKSGYNDILKTVTIISGQTISLSESLIAQTGSISVSSNPSGANVYLDGTYKGISPMVISNVPIGSYTVKLTKSGYNDISKTVTVSLGQTISVSQSLTAQTGSISASSSPSGARVYLDGVYKGTTPLTLNSVSSGTHVVKLTKSGYTDISNTVTVNSGQTASISKILSSSVETTPVETTPVETTPVETTPVEKENPTNTKIIGVIFGLLIFGIIIKKLSNSSKDITPSKSMRSEETGTSNLASPLIPRKNSPINIKSAFGYKGATIQYKIKIENPTPEPIGDIKVNLYVPDVFLVSEITKTIVMLKPNEAKTVTFEIRPTGECGDCEVSGKVIYYDYSTKKTNEMDIPTKSLSIVCPMLKVKEINESEWHNIVGSLVETEENTREIDMPAETLFAMLSRIVKDMHMYSLKPEITGDQQIFNGVARFYGEGVKDLKYAAQIEVVGGAKRSKLILKAWAEREDALTGFYHGILDELEKRVQVKGYIDDSIVQNFYHYGDNIGTQVKDSFVYKSNVGNGDAGTCPQCGKEKAEGEAFCSGCGVKF